MIIDLLARVPDIGIGELAELTGLPRSTVYRVLPTLLDRGFVEKGPNAKSYRLGTRLLFLGHRAAQQLEERQAAMPAMEYLHDSSGQTVFLFLRRQYLAVCVERFDGEVVSTSFAQVGDQLVLYAGMVGPLLAFESDDFVTRYLSQNQIVALTPNAPSNQEQVLKRIAEIRSNGYSVSDEDTILGIASLSAPVLNHRGAVCAAICLAGPRASVLGDAREDYAMLLLDAAARSSVRMGYDLPTDRLLNRLPVVSSQFSNPLAPTKQG